MSISSHDARRRDRHRLAVTAVTGVVTVASLTGTGAAVGKLHREAAADAAAAGQAAPQTPQAQQPRQRARRQPALRERPTRTRVTTRYVQQDSGDVVGGGTVSSPPSGGAPAPAAPAPAAPAPAPAPAPEPPPAPSSGS